MDGGSRFKRECGVDCLFEKRGDDFAEMRHGIIIIIYKEMTEEDKTQQVEEEQKEESTLETAIHAVIKQAIINQGRTLEWGECVLTLRRITQGLKWGRQGNWSWRCPSVSAREELRWREIQATHHLSLSDAQSPAPRGRQQHWDGKMGGTLQTGQDRRANQDQKNLVRRYFRIRNLELGNGNNFRRS